MGFASAVSNIMADDSSVGGDIIVTDLMKYMDEYDDDYGKDDYFHVSALLRRNSANPGVPVSLNRRTHPVGRVFHEAVTRVGS